MEENIALVAHYNKKKDLLTLIIVAVLGLAKVSSLSGPVVP